MASEATAWLEFTKNELNVLRVAVSKELEAVRVIAHRTASPTGDNPVVKHLVDLGRRIDDKYKQLPSTRKAKR